jgi:hypothetical protein
MLTLKPYLIRIIGVTNMKYILIAVAFLFTIGCVSETPAPAPAPAPTPPPVSEPTLDASDIGNANNPIGDGHVTDSPNQ